MVWLVVPVVEGFPAVPVPLLAVPVLLLFVVSFRALFPLAPAISGPLLPDPFGVDDDVPVVVTAPDCFPDDDVGAGAGGSFDDAPLAVALGENAFGGAAIAASPGLVPLSGLAET